MHVSHKIIIYISINVGSCCFQFSVIDLKYNKNWITMQDATILSRILHKKNNIELEKGMTIPIEQKSNCTG